MVIKFSDEIIENLKYFSVYFYLIENFLNKIKDNEIIINDNSFDSAIVELDYNSFKILFTKNNKTIVQKWKIGRFINHIYDLLFQQTLEEEELSYLYQSFLGAVGFKKWLEYNDYKIVIDKNFIESYDSNKYVHNIGSLGHSCMNNKKESVKFYNVIESKLSIIKIVNSSNQIAGRALLWETDRGLYIDRFYCVNNIYFFGFYMYMDKFYNIKNNYLEFHSYMEILTNKKPLSIYRVFINVKDMIKSMNKIYKEINKYEIEKNWELLYLDSMKYFKIENEKIILSNTHLPSYEFFSVHCSKIIDFLLEADETKRNIIKRKIFRLELNDENILSMIKDEGFDIKNIIDNQRLSFLKLLTNNIFVIIDKSINLCFICFYTYGFLYIIYVFKNENGKIFQLKNITNEEKNNVISFFNNKLRDDEVIKNTYTKYENIDKLKIINIGPTEFIHNIYNRLTPTDKFLINKTLKNQLNSLDFEKNIFFGINYETSYVLIFIGDYEKIMDYIQTVNITHNKDIIILYDNIDDLVNDIEDYLLH